MRSNSGKLIGVLLTLVPTGALFFIWELYVSKSSTLEFFLGKPSSIGRIFAEEMAGGRVPADLVTTLAEAAGGLVIGGMLSLFAGVSISEDKRVNRVFLPLVIGVTSVPLFAFGPLLTFWLGTGYAAKVAISAAAVLAVMLPLSHQFGRETPVSLREVFMAMGASRMEQAIHLAGPYVALGFASHMRLAVGAALTGAIVGEFISANKGIGYFIVLAEGLYDVNRIWVGILVLTVAALVLAGIADIVENWARPRKAMV